ncbi:MAG: pilus assembly protein [Alphaproteobacteria bacterium]|nr:pilus assembly protein [Alphaproteobacteria bacterium]
MMKECQHKERKLSWYQQMLVRCWRHWRKTHGAAMIEFAIIAPVFLTILIGIFDVGIMMIIRTSLEEGARAASRYGITGGSSGSLTRSGSINQVILNTIGIYSGGLVDTSKVTITVKSYSSLSNVGQPEPFIDTNGDGKYEGPGQPGGPEPFTDVNSNGKWDADQGLVGSYGTGGQAVEYLISYQWTPYVLGFIPALGTITMTGTATVDNEAF